MPKRTDEEDDDLLLDDVEHLAEPGVEYGDEAQETAGLTDLVSGEAIKVNEAELLRQEEERKLLEEFGYDQADYRDLIRRGISVKPGQDKARKFPLVVLRPPNGVKVNEMLKRLYILIDIVPKKTKPEDSKKGADALAEFLKDTAHAEYAVWTNGTERIVWWKNTDALKVRAYRINDIPRYGKGRDDSFGAGRQKLRKAVSGSLRQAFQRCHDYIYAVRGGSNESVFLELLKVIFAKIEDERQMVAAKNPDDVGLFAIQNLDEIQVLNPDFKDRHDPAKAEAVSKRVHELYDRVRQRHPELFSTLSDTIDLPPRVITYLVAHLGHYDLLNSSVDVKGEAYEAIVGKNLQGTRGEFFTPRNAVKLAVRILDPKPGQKCIDPATGTGGFIVVILNYMSELIRREVGLSGPGAQPTPAKLAAFQKRLRVVSQNIFGTDINPNLVRVARMNMVMNNDGQGGITHLDGLQTRKERWDTLPKGRMRRYRSDGTEYQVDVQQFFKEELEEGTFDIVATNPPFGTKIKIDDEEVLRDYELGHDWKYDEERLRWIKQAGKLSSGQPPEILFIERVVRLLKPGTGRACMVLPNGILGNPNDEYIRAWLLRNTQIEASISMPVELFLPKVGIQTHLLFFRRKSVEEMNLESLGKGEKDYDIFMAVARKVGKDRRGNAIHKRDADGTVLTNFKEFEGRNLHEEWRNSTVVDLVPEVDEYGRMIDDDLPFIAAEFRKFRLEGTTRGRE